ncbi:MAG TPA: cupin domain-containing protein [Solirubrobacteraceae bacterium]
MSDRDAVVANWGADGFFFTEAGRGGSLPWRVGGSKLEGDALGPVRHAHDDAAEYYFMFSGSAHVETGGEEFVLEEGQLGYIPPDAPHNFLGPATDRDACLFCVVGPNFTYNKWRVKDFKPGSESLRMAVGTPFEDDALPAGGTLSAEALALSPGEAPIAISPSGLEIIYMPVEGSLEISLFGGLHGTIHPGTYVHVRDGVRHELSASGAPAKVLRMNCGFAAWEGVATAADAA